MRNTTKCAKETPEYFKNAAEKQAVMQTAAGSNHFGYTPVHVTAATAAVKTRSPINARVRVMRVIHHATTAGAAS